MRTVMKITLALAAAWLLAGCSALRFAYESADSYLLYRAKGYLELDEKGSDELEQRIEEFFAWHRRNALPQYARISEDAAKRITKGLSREDLVWGYDSLVANARQSLRVAAERIAPLLDRLTPDFDALSQDFDRLLVGGGTPQIDLAVPQVGEDGAEY